MDQFLANATNTVKARWDKLPTSTRWLLFLPLTLIASILVWLVVGSFTLLPGFETGIANTLANAMASAAFTVCFIWCCLHLPPNRGHAIARTLFTIAALFHGLMIAQYLVPNSEISFHLGIPHEAAIAQSVVFIATGIVLLALQPKA